MESCGTVAEIKNLQVLVSRSRKGRSPKDSGVQQSHMPLRLECKTYAALQKQKCNEQRAWKREQVPANVLQFYMLRGIVAVETLIS